MSIKKFVAILLHVLALIVVGGALWALHFNEYQGGNEAYSKLDYEESSQFLDQFMMVAESAVDKIRTGAIFETDGQLDFRKNLITFYDYDSEEQVSFNMNDFIQYGKQRGIYLDTDNVVQNEGYSISDGHNSDVILISVIEEINKNIDINLYLLDELDEEDEDQELYISLENLTYYLLERLGEYYQATDILEEKGNFIYWLTYYDSKEQEVVYSNMPESNLEELRSISGKFIYNATNLVKVEGNLDIDWTTINEWVELNNLYGLPYFSILFLVDTSYPIKTDIFAIGQMNYETGINTYIYGNFFLGLGLAVLCLTLLYLAIVSGKNNQGEYVLGRLDFWSIEPAVLAWLLLYGSIWMVLPGFIQLMYISMEYKQYVTELSRMLVTYVFAVCGVFSCLRRLKTGELYQDSYVIKALAKLNQYFDKKGFPLKLVLGFFLIAGGNSIMALLLKKHWLILLLVFVLINTIILYLLLRKEGQQRIVSHAIERLSEGDLDYKVEIDYLNGVEKDMGEKINRISKVLKESLDEKMKSERLKTDLITNVSHDIKTPLTSIINYVDLLKRENIKDEKILNYIEVLEQKSQRLKVLTEDLVEASKASSGNIKLELMKIDIVQFVNQTNGEFEEKFEEANLELIRNIPQESMIALADGRRLWRVFENLYVNALKYAMPNTRVYVDLYREGSEACFTIKNISRYPLNITPDELTERFVRGDSARTTEGSGLGLSIAKSLTKLQGGDFEIQIDGDLYKVTVKIPCVK